MPEIAGDAAILVSPLQLEEISEALEKVIQNPEIRAKMIASGYDNAQKYSWKHSGEKLALLCSKLLNQYL